MLLTSKKDPSNKITNDTYDANGNLTKAVYDPTGANQTTLYTYDGSNRLTGVTEPNGTTVTLTYDADGNRTQKTLNGTTISDVYALGHLDHQTDGSGNILATFTYDATGEPTSVVVGNPTSGTRYSYVYNGHGDVVALVDASGNIKASYSDDAFGNLISSSEILANGWSNPYRYDGAELVRYDTETNLYWMSVRAYDPTLGRFISHDPLGRLAAMGVDTQPYGYANNNPVNQTDPSGLLSCGAMVDGQCRSYWHKHPNAADIDGCSYQHMCTAPAEPPQPSIDWTDVVLGIGEVIGGLVTLGVGIYAEMQTALAGGWFVVFLLRAAQIAVNYFVDVLIGLIRNGIGLIKQGFGSTLTRTWRIVLDIILLAADIAGLAASGYFLRTEVLKRGPRYIQGFWNKLVYVLKQLGKPQLPAASVFRQAGTSIVGSILNIFGAIPSVVNDARGLIADIQSS